MKKIDLGQTIGILANLGVIAGIVFLAFELRQNNAELASQTRTNVYQMRTDMERDFISNAGGIADALAALRQGDELSRSQIVRIGARRGLAFNTFQFMFLEDRESARRVAGWMAVVVRTDPGMLDFWTENQDSFDPDFVNFFETEVMPAL